ncbi:hypothetical protein TNCV_2534121 [Trichonephila clavipes]|nr:hypothetical protein TNCV_2534121 [Trichonephila clavipes]
MFDCRNQLKGVKCIVTNECVSCHGLRLPLTCAVSRRIWKQSRKMNLALGFSAGAFIKRLQTCNREIALPSRDPYGNLTCFRQLVQNNQGRMRVESSDSVAW